MSDEKRCCGELRGFAAGRCDHQGSIEHKGRWYCGKHDPRPVVLEGEPQYVWEVWSHQMFKTPHVARYRLVKMNPKGGATVLKNGFQLIIKPASDKKFFTSLEDLHAHLARWHAGALAQAKRDVVELERVAEDPQKGITIEEVRDRPYERVGAIVTE